MPRAPIRLDLTTLLPSWELSLRAERKSPSTIKSYTEGVRQFLLWCERESFPAALSRDLVNGFTADLLDAGAEAATVRSRQLGVRRFSAWLADEQEQATDPLLGIKAPKLDQRVVEPLTDDQLRALIKACSGREFRERRDEAIVRFMLETGVRAGEVVSLLQADVDLITRVAIVRRGKGGKGRSVPFGDQTALALDRYVRIRRQHKLADSPELLLGDRNRGPITYHSLYWGLNSRAEAAGIADFHPHRLRHTAAHRWLAAGGSEGGLMAVAGWTRPDMLVRYTKARAADRAATEARSLNLGNL